MTRIFKYLLLATITLIFIVFAVANREVVTITLYPFPYSADMPKFLLVIAAFALGILTAGVTLSGRSMRSRSLYKSEHKRVMALENELEGLKGEHSSIPVLRGNNK